MFGTPKEPGDVECALGELPSLLDSREKEISRILIEKTQKQRTTIRDLRSSLKELVKDLTSKEREEAYHPKLETIAKNTLPLFERAMFSSLSKDLPEDPDLFYLAATESLKGCVKSLSGQGRYLRGVFPEEMKEIREMVDQIGREMNAMTPAIAEARTQREVLSAVRIDLSRLNSAEKEKKRTTDEINLLRGDIVRETGDIDRLCDRIKAINEAIDQGSLRNLQEELATAKSEFLEKEMSLQADLAVVAHVFRKAEKVLGRTLGTGSAKDIESFVDTLAGSGIPAEDQILPDLIRLLPIIASMRDSGDLVLKNKEEKELFSREMDLPSRIRDGYARREVAYRSFHAKEHAYKENPLLVELSTLQREADRRKGHAEALTSRLSSIIEKNTALEKEIPDLEERVRSDVGRLLGHAVSIAMDDATEIQR